MDRRDFVRKSAVLVPVAVAGCSLADPRGGKNRSNGRPGGGVTGSDERRETASAGDGDGGDRGEGETPDFGTVPEPKEFPELGDLDGTESKLQYVEDHEEVRLYNEWLDSATRNVDVDCTATLAVETGEELYAATSCFRSQLRVEGDQTMIGEGVAPASLYLVTETETKRIDTGEQGQAGLTDIWISNFDDSERSLSLRVEFRSGDEPVVIHDETHEIAAESGIALRSVAGEYGTYELIGELEDGTETTHRLELSEDFSRAPFAAVHVSPDGSLEIADFDLQRPT